MLAPRLPLNAYRYKRGEMQGGGGPAEDVYLTWTGSAVSCWWSQEGEIDREIERERWSEEIVMKLDTILDMRHKDDTTQ